MQALGKGTVPTVYVSTEPAELIQTQGEPQLQPISGTRLLSVQNTADSIFVDESHQDFYILISGRWYASKLLNGPWHSVSARSLPRDFAKIPESHPKATVLASVSGTPQAQEAGIANEVPQTATVDRIQASLTVQYDGPPQFKPIEGTPLYYAANTRTPVIEVDSKTYFAVDNGIWFEATAPQGMWVVATRVPAVIYTIPPSSPVYNVTYVHVYGWSPEVVYEGYTPGYLGSYVDADGVVVYGTGYYYHPWIGTYWIGPPVTYGCGFVWGPGFGWGFSAGLFTGVFVGAVFSPWWGPWWGTHVTFNINRTNVYQHWGRPVVRNTWERNEFANRFRPVERNRASNNVYAGPNGHVYRHSERGWEEHGTQGWRAPSHGGVGGPSRELDQNRVARSTGERRWNEFRGGGQPQSGQRRPYLPGPGSGYSAGNRGGRSGDRRH